VRAVAPGDLPEVQIMVQGLAAHHGDTATVSLADLRRDMLGEIPWVHGLVAQMGPDLCGYAALCPLVQVQYGVRGMDLHHLFVKSEWRQQGVATALIRAALERTRALGARYMMVGTHPENLLAGQIYRDRGFDEMSGPGPRFRMKLPEQP